jgi:hypothetical protein
MPEFKLKEYCRDKNGNKVGILFAEAGVDKHLRIGTSFANTKYDDFIDDIHMVRMFYGEFEKIPFAFKEQFDRFLKRCAKYFKNGVVYPEWFPKQELSLEHMFNESWKSMINRTINWNKEYLIYTPLGGNNFYRRYCNNQLNKLVEETNRLPIVTIVEVTHCATYGKPTKNIIFESDTLFPEETTILVINGNTYKRLNQETFYDVNKNYSHYTYYVERTK